MKIRVLDMAVSVAMLFGALPQSAMADDSGKPEYSVLYHGNFSDEDAHRFSALLYNFGGSATWTGATQWSYTGDERDVNHWDYTNGNASVDPYLPANRADLLYASGHGGTNGLMIYSPLRHGDKTREKDVNGRSDNVGPDSGLALNESVESDGVEVERIGWEIGSDFIGANRTISRWDDDIEWIFLAACDQLAGKSSLNGRTSFSRRNYARTLLGDPRRAHAIWSYRGLAPNDGVDVQMSRSSSATTWQRSRIATRG